MSSIKRSWSSIWRRLASATLALTMVATIALASLVLVIPWFLGAVPLTVLTGSMRPVIEPGDLIVSRAVEVNELRIGDVITYQPFSGDPTLFTHRIVDLTRNFQGEVLSVTTRGDANNVDDAPIVPEQVMGRLVYRVPRVGFLTNNRGIGLRLGMVTGVALIGYALFQLKPAKTVEESNQAGEAVTGTIELPREPKFA